MPHDNECTYQLFLIKTHLWLWAQVTYIHPIPQDLGFEKHIILQSITDTDTDQALTRTNVKWVDFNLRERSLFKLYVLHIETI